MARATSSLPVPLSPRISTVASVGGDPGDQAADLAHARALADQVVIERGVEAAPLFFQPLQALDVGQGQGGDAGHGREQLQVVLLESGPRLQGIDVQGSQQTFPDGQGSGEERLDVGHPHALRLAEDRGLADVVGQDGRALGQDLADEGAGHGEGIGLAVSAPGRRR